MSKTPEVKKEKCPSCGTEYDPSVDELIECPECCKMGSTACCMSAGRGTMCTECQEKE